MAQQILPPAPRVPITGQGGLQTREMTRFLADLMGFLGNGGGLNFTDLSTLTYLSLRRSS